MATVQQMAIERGWERWADPKGSEDEILNYFQGYSQGAYDILSNSKELSISMWALITGTIEAFIGSQAGGHR